MINTHFEIKDYIDDGISYRDLTKKDNPKKGSIYVMYQPLEEVLKDDLFFAFADPLDVPSQRYLSVSSYVLLATMQPTQEEILQTFKRCEDLHRSGKSDELGAMIIQASKAMQLTDPVEKFLRLATAFIFYEDENPIFYSTKHNTKKKAYLLGLPEDAKNKVAEWCMNYFAILINKLQTNNPECFVSTDDEKEGNNFFAYVSVMKEREKDINMLLREMSGGVLSEREQLLEYTIGDLYADMRYFVMEQEAKAKALKPD